MKTHKQFNRSILTLNFVITAMLITTTSVAQANANSNTDSTTSSLIDGLQVGVNAMYKDKGYKDYDNTVSILPSFFYDNGTVYARGNHAGYNLIKNKQNEFSVFAQYAGASYDPDNADGSLSKLDERESTLMAGISYLYRSPFGGIRGQVATDVLDKSNGSIGRLTYLARYKNNGLTLYPSIGLQWQNDSYNDYYYGVSSNESTKAGINQYTADSSIHPYVNVTGFYDLGHELNLFMSQNLSYNPDEVYESPMIDSRTSMSTTVGLLYEF